MFILAGTSSLAVLVASVTSVENYLYLKVRVEWVLAAIELIGVTKEWVLRLLLAVLFI